MRPSDSDQEICALPDSDFNRYVSKKLDETLASVKGTARFVYESTKPKVSKEAQERLKQRYKNTRREQRYQRAWWERLAFWRRRHG